MTPCVSKTVCKNLAFALILIAAAGAVVVGVLAYYKIAFFGGMGTIGTQACLYGGSALAAVTIVAKAIDTCLEKYRRYRTQANLSVDPTDIQDTNHFSSGGLPQSRPLEEDPPSLLSEDVSTPSPTDSKTEAVPHNNLHPVFQISEPKPYSLEEIETLPRDARLHLGDQEKFTEFYMESQILFHEAASGYLNDSLSSSSHHFEALRQERIESVRTLRGPPPEVTIVGGGPGGLVAALEAYLAGANVHLIEKRVDYSRDTMFRLQVETAQYLERRLGPHFYLIASSNELIKQRRQGFFEREFFGPEEFIMVETKVNEWMLALLLFELAKRDPALKIYREWECVDVEDNQSEGKASVTIQDAFLRTHQIPSDIVIGADGTRSKVRASAEIEWTPISTSRPSVAVTFTNLWANNLAYEDLSSFIPQAYEEGFASLREEDKSEELVQASRNVRTTIRPHIEAQKWEAVRDDRFRSFMQARGSAVPESVIRKEMAIAREGGRLLHGRLVEMGWNLERLPSNRLFTSSHTIYLGTDLPERLLHADRSEVLPWIAATLEQNLPRSAVKLLMSQIRTCTVFTSQLFRASHVRKGRCCSSATPSGRPIFKQEAVRRRPWTTPAQSENSFTILGTPTISRKISAPTRAQRLKGRAICSKNHSISDSAAHYEFNV